MKLKKKNSLKLHVWLYLIIFGLALLLFLWLFQITFVDKFYEYSKSRQIKKTASKIVDIYNNRTSLDKVSFSDDVCIEIVQSNYTIYSSSYNKGCLTSDEYKKDFYNSNLENKTYELINPKFNNKSLVYAVKVNNYTYAFVSSSLVPLDTTVMILSRQLIIVSFIVLLLSLLIGYFISKRLSKPIEKMNENAKKLASGNYEFEFDNNSNIYEIDELANTLNYAKKELEQTDELRRDLLANVSHDLKTPLTMIKGYAEMVRDLTYNNEEKRNNNLNVIIEETDRLNHLVEDILTLSKIQANKDELNIEKFDLCELINTIVNRYSIYKDTQGYIFELNIPSKLIISADKKKIEQVIYNLINNAINYTGKDNKIIINIYDTDRIRVEIKDTGRGIKEEDISNIWNKYYHSNKKHKRNVIGTGLGLSIVKTILESHNFRYGVISKKNRGTIFYFEIQK